MFELGIILLIIGAIALIVFYTAAPEPLLRVIGLVCLVLGVVLLLVPLVLDAADEGGDATVFLLNVLL